MSEVGVYPARRRWVLSEEGYWPRRCMMSVVLSGGERAGEGVSEVAGGLMGQSGRSHVMPAVWCRGVRGVLWG